MGDQGSLPPAGTGADAALERYPVDQPAIGADGAGPVTGTPAIAPSTVPAPVVPVSEPDKLTVGSDPRTAGRRLTGQLMEADKSNPTIGAEGSGVPVVRAGVPQPPGPNGVSVTLEHFKNQYEVGDPTRELTTLTNGSFWVPGQTQTWPGLLRQALGDQLQAGPLGEVSPGTIQLLSEAVARLNGRSSLEKLPSVVAIPNLTDLKAILDSMDKRTRSNDPPAVRAAVLEAQQAYNKGQPFPTHFTPKAGHTYDAKWNDTLRGVVLNAYPHLFVTPNNGSVRPDGRQVQSPDEILKDLMLAVAAVNNLQSTDLGDAGVLWLPDLKRAEEIVNYLKDSRSTGEGGPETTRLDLLKQRAPDLWASIRRTGVGAVADLRWIAGMNIRAGEGAMSRTELRSEIGNARRTLNNSGFTNAYLMCVPAAMFDPFGMFPAYVAEWACTASPTPIEELPTRHTGETFEAFVQRIEADITPEELKRTKDDPLRFLMRRMGVASSSGNETNAAAYGQFVRTVQKLGLVNEAGTTSIPTRPGETRKQALNRALMVAIERSGLLAPLVANLPAEERAKATKALVDGGPSGLSTSGWQTRLNDQQKDQLSALIAFMGFVEGESERAAGGSARADGRDICISMQRMMSRDVKKAVAAYQPRELEQYLLRPEPNVDVPEESSWLERITTGMAGDGKPVRRSASVSANGAADALSEAGIAQKSEARKSEAVNEQYVKNAKVAQVEAADAAVAVNQAESRGEPVRGQRGGPKRRN